MPTTSNSNSKQLDCHGCHEGACCQDIRNKRSAQSNTSVEEGRRCTETAKGLQVPSC